MRIRSIRLVTSVAVGVLVVFSSGVRSRADVDAGSDETPDVREVVDFDVVLEGIRARQEDLRARWRAAGLEERRLLRDEARVYVVDSIVEEIFPAWLGVPWTMAIVKDGLKPDSRVPFEEGRGVSCSFFVTSVLQNAGLRLTNRRKFAGANSLPIQLSFTKGRSQRRRWSRITPTELEQHMLKWGDGLYLVGLSCHIGFIVVRGEEVRFVHSSYLEPYEVVNEPLARSPAIEASRSHVVTTLFRDNRLIEHWLTGRKVPFGK